MADFAKLLPYSGLICIKFAQVRDAYNSATNRIKAEVFMTQASAPNTQSKGGVIQDWRPEEPDFWQQIGQKQLNVIYGFQFPVYYSLFASGCCSAR